MSAIVLAGLELTAGAEPTAIITEESELPKSAICHITRATLVPCATQSTFYLKASISDSQDIVLAAVSSSQPSVGLDLVFHADSTPMFSVTSVPELKGEAEAEVHRPSERLCGRGAGRGRHGRRRRRRRGRGGADGGGDGGDERGHQARRVR